MRNEWSGGVTETKTPEEVTHKTLLAALLAAQREMPAVKPDSVNPHYKSRFVTLGHLIAKVRPVLNKHGLAFAQFPSSDEHGNPTLVTVLMHASGERMEYAAPLFLPKSDPQGQGSAITYLRRYALASALGISDQEDDDGNAAAPQKPKQEVPLYSKPKDAVSLDRAGELAKGIKLRGLSYGRINEFLTAAKVGPIKTLNGSGLRNRLETLTVEEAEAFEREMAAGDELPVDVSQ
jgi:hypothetical protein